jgi:hypothetical protein
MLNRVLILTLLLGLTVSASSQALPLLVLDPTNGAVAGVPGATVGWGFSITNTDNNFLVVTGARFDTKSNIGTFTDFISASNFVVVGPLPENSSVNQALNVASAQGLGCFTISPGTLTAYTASGDIVISYDLFTMSPNDQNFDPGTAVISSGNQLFAAASVTVLDPAVVPEPSTIILLGLAFGGFVFIRK